MHELKRFTINNKDLTIYYDKDKLMQEIIESELADSLVFSNELGFSPLGNNIEKISEYLSIPIGEIAKLTNENRDHNLFPNLLGIKNRSSEHNLKGVVVASSENSLAYSRYANPQYGKPYRDFYYILTYESLLYADSILNARRIGLTHLTICDNYSVEVALSQIDAIRNYFNKYPNTNLERILFWGCCHEEYCFNKIHWLDDDDNPTHREINKTFSKLGEVDLISIQLRKRSKYDDIKT